MYYNSNKKIRFNETFEEMSSDASDRIVVPLNKVREGQAIVSSEFNYSCKYENCYNKNITLKVNNQYYDDSANFKVISTYNKNNFTRITGLNHFWNYEHAIFINPNEYNRLFNKGIYQSSVYIQDIKLADETNIDATGTAQILIDNSSSTLALKDGAVEFRDTHFDEQLDEVQPDVYYDNEFYLHTNLVDFVQT